MQLCSTFNRSEVFGCALGGICFFLIEVLNVFLKVGWLSGCYCKNWFEKALWSEKTQYLLINFVV